ncbi:GNAT family N-acetyltransferase [Anaerocolumna xylanovorans]|uniref:Ribosomal-protein-alanine N-acetyltransferase n=1 Tax=Anaerocolumna xylanovorans DSM 12503 TaxID=1121345 RepID=A0A1M7Y5N0_9FIRM|nr:GNAT family protein [Anaerocolumna xylanovorans]SHO47760.1 ribosomal-protein-alanine N-acetyltransferase [Anaerocolumna xylanovorans DSM 12503]
MYYDKLFKNFPIIEDDDILMKQIEKQDLSDYVEINMNEVLYRFKPGEPRKTIAAVENIIGHHERDFYKKIIINLGIYLKKDNNKMVGVAELFDFDTKVSAATIGYTLNQNYWGKGIATKTTALLLNYLFNEIDVNRVQAFVMPQNEKSKKVLLRNDFIKEGTIRQGNYWKGRGIVDLELYSILKPEYSYKKS